MSREDRVLEKIKSIELRTRKLVRSLNLGDYKSALKGQGMTFSDFREYVPGDDVRNISWTLIAKTNKPYVKQFEEERELSIYFLVDTSESMFMGQKGRLKIEVALYSVAALAMSAQKNNDLSGLILFSKNLNSFIKPKKSLSHVRRLITEILKVQPQRGASQGLGESCNMLLKHQKKRAIIFIFSDFLNVPESQKILQSLSKKHQVVTCVIKDSQEEKSPYQGLGKVCLNSLGENIVVNMNSSGVQKRTFKYFNHLIEKRSEFLKNIGGDCIEFFTDKDIFKPIILYFKKKSRAL